MSDPIGTSGGARGGGDADVAAALHGGPGFMARLHALGEARDAHDAAFSRLKIGQSAATAYAEGTRLRDEAAGDRQEAAAELDGARREAARIVGEARSQASSILADARASANDAEAAATETLQRASAQAAAAQATANDLERTWRSKHAETEAAKDDVARKAAQYDEAITAAKEEREQAVKLRAELQQIKADLLQVLNGIE